MDRYKVHLDLVLRFVPPMTCHGDGISLKRVVELPFPPCNGLGLFAKDLEQCPEPVGMNLTDVIWDLDREVFLAKTAIDMEMPLADIVVEIRSWIESGWKLGSFLDDYETDQETQREPPVEITGDDCSFDGERTESWPSKKPSKRPQAFNVLFQATIRKMVEIHNNVSVAYAMAKTHQFFTEEEVKRSHAKDVLRFRNICYEFDQMPIDGQVKWMKRIKRTYPRLEQLLR